MADARKVLVVDDNQTIRKLLERRLLAEGFLVLTASNGQEGLAAAVKEMPDLIVSDINMPVMDGGEMASRLRASFRTSRIPIIFLTSLVTKDEGREKSSSEDLYLSKMCKPTEIVVAIRNRLSLSPK
jgi:CheY-like chemotaxis protein